jgi:hypothetical protein
MLPKKEYIKYIKHIYIYIYIYIKSLMPSASQTIIFVLFDE